MINYNELLKVEMQGIYGDQLQRVSRINKYYKIYEGGQAWPTPGGLDYRPTKKITNIIKKLIDTRARFMFGREPFFNFKQIEPDSKGSTANADLTQQKEDLLADILEENKFHSKLLKARKDCSIGGKVAIKLWANRDIGLKIIFSPAQEFFPQYNLDDVDRLEKVVFLYALNDESLPENQRVKKQVWEMQNGRCILNESTHDGMGLLLSTEYQDYNTGLDFIPVVIIQNGGLTGETDGVSDVARLWGNQDSYNRLTSDDIDALKFQMFGQDVITDASEKTFHNIKIAPGAMIDLESDMAQASQGRQASINRLESNFSYKDKFEDTVNRIKNDMYDSLEVPNVSLEQLRGLMQSGKSMRALYWGLMAACDEDWTEWGPALKQMVDYIFRMVDTYNLYEARPIARYETTMDIEKTYPIQEDEDEQKQVDMAEVIDEVRSRKSYMKKWGEYEDIDAELEQILKEKELLGQDVYTQDLEADINGDGDDDSADDDDSEE